MKEWVFGEVCSIRIDEIASFNQAIIDGNHTIEFVQRSGTITRMRFADKESMVKAYKLLQDNLRKSSTNDLHD